ncbi:MAG: hypothetical protein ABJA02_10525 [Acidobacteriota bacterium]
MLTSSILIFFVTFGGFALTYLVADDEKFMWRLAVGSIVGSAIYGLVGFLLAMAFGLNATISGLALVLTVMPAALLLLPKYRSRSRHDWVKAKGKLQGGNLRRFSGFAYYAFFVVLFWLFFNQAMYENAQGIFTGGSNNLGDLPFHLGAIFGFTDGNNFPPQNPSFAGAKFSYPFVADFLTACFIKLGADVKDAMFVQNVTWAFSLVVIIERFTIKLTGSKLAGRISPFLLIFSGGLGFIGFFKDYWAQGKGIFDFISTLPRDYTISDSYRWGNSMVVLFMTQRSLLLGMPLTVTVLGYLWRVFGSEAEGNADTATTPRASGRYLGYAKPLVVGLLAGTLPLIHLHSLVVLFVVTAFLFAFRPASWRTWLTFGIGVCVIAVPELLWTMSGTASETSKFIGWHFGWDKRDDNIIWFWIKNTGLVLPGIAAGAYLVYSRLGVGREGPKGKEATPPPFDLIKFYLPFGALFFVANIAKLAPWEWDNIKVLIYWFVGSVPLISYAIAWAWRKDAFFKTTSGIAFSVLILAGTLDVWRTASGQNKIQVFDADAVKIAEQIKQKTPPNALFLNAPTFNSAVVLSGRQSYMRYTGHLMSHGIDFGEREDQVKRIYSGGGVSDLLLGMDNIDYVLVSPEERNSLQAKDENFTKYPVIAESGQYRVYKIK